MSRRGITRRNFLARAATVAAAGSFASSRISAVAGSSTVLEGSPSAAAAYDPTPPPSPWGPADEAGNTNLLTPSKALQARDLIRTGRSFVLAHISENGMPLTPANTWVQTLKASVAVNQQVANTENIVADFTQDGTQFDALCHMGYIPSALAPITSTLYYNRFRQLQVVGAEGLKKGAVDKLRPYFTRGILVDVSRYLFGNRVLPEATEITVPMMWAALAAQGMTEADILPGDVVLFRTGWERNWRVTPGSIQSTLAYYKGFPGVPGGVPGVGLNLAVRLTALQVAGVGADNWGVDALPPRNPPPGVALPVHLQLLTRGIPLFESLVLEPLSEHLASEYAGGNPDAYTFAFIFSPLRIKGGTGSPAAPLAYT